MITHHPSHELLLDYAAGSLGEGAALAVATHLSLCRRCAEAYARLTTVGGALLDGIDAVAVSERTLAATLARLDEPAPAEAVRPNLDAETRRLVPAPLRAYLPASLNALPWRGMAGMFEEFRLPLAVKGIKASLMRLKPGAVMPRHTHRGDEYTMVLAGGYRDNGKSFIRGDFDAKDASHDHRPVVDDDGECLCLAVLDAPVRLTGTFSRIVNPFLRI